MQTFRLPAYLKVFAFSAFVSKLPGYLKVVALMTVVNLLMLGIRNVIVGNEVFDFLRSNLFSGYLPLVIAFFMQRYYYRLNTAVFWIGAALWLLFYPNAPYMISDLIHDSQDVPNPAMPDLIIYDTLIIFSIAMLSVFYGFISLKIMFNLFRKKYTQAFAHIAILFSLVMSCLGFYMGRVLKSDIDYGNGYLYSWEIFLHPVSIIKQVWNALFPVNENLDAWAMMALFGVVQYMLLAMMKDVGDIESDDLLGKEDVTKPK